MPCFLHRLPDKTTYKKRFSSSAICNIGISSGSYKTTQNINVTFFYYALQFITIIIIILYLVRRKTGRKPELRCRLARYCEEQRKHESEEHLKATPES